MKRIRNILALLLVLSLLPILPVFAAETATLTESADFKKLEAFGIMTENDEILKCDSVSRRQFIYYAMKCCYGNYMFGSDAVQLPFNDVSPSDLGSKEIAVAHQLGIISGKTEDKFFPDDNISMNEAAKVLVAILGYGTVAANEGGYPIGYMTYANSFKLFRGCSATSSASIPVSDFLKMLLNTLDSDVMTATAIQLINNAYSISSYSAKEGSTLLENSFGIRRAEGIVEANEYTSMNGLSSLPEGVVTINSANYSVNGTDAADLIGYKTEYYFSVDDVKTNKDIVYIAPYFDVEVIEVSSRNIVPGATTTTNFCYYESDSAERAENIAISRATVLFHNGGQKRISVSDICPTNGTVTIIDNNKDEVADVIKVMDYRTMQVASVSPSTYTVTDALGGSAIVLDPAAMYYNTVIYKDGKEADFSSIAVDDVISYAESVGNNRNIKYLMVSSAKAEGTLDIIGDDYIEVGRVPYPYDNSISDDLHLGTVGTYYLDFNGRVVAAKVSRDYVYGYLTKLEKGNFGLVGARIFTENNRWGVLEFNESITYNGVRTPATAVYNALTGMGDYCQLIRYTVDPGGKINMIELSENVTPYSVYEEETISNDNFRAYPELTTARFRSSISGFNNEFRIGDSTKIFMIPEGNAPEEDFHIVEEDFFFSNEVYYNITGYDIDKTKLAGATVLRGNDVLALIDEDTAFLVVDSVGKTMNAAGEVVDCVRGYYNGTMITLTTKDESVLSDVGVTLEKGDAVQFSIDADGNVKRFIMRFDLSEGVDQQFIVNNLYATVTFVAGEVLHSDSVQRTYIADITQKALLMTKPSTEIWVYDIAGGTITLGSVADLEVGSHFVSRLHYYVSEEIVVYR